MISLQQITSQSPYAGYAYSYPHKSAYRALNPAISLRNVWQKERRDALFLYLHVPFCEMRCGFCNLFTAANPRGDIIEGYLAAFRRQAQRVGDILRDAKFARFAVGGGTPTFLSIPQLEALFDTAGDCFGIEPGATGCSVETSPRTAESEKLALLRGRGVTRISIGVQSLIEAEVRGAGRAQQNLWVEQAIDRIHKAGFPTLNIDLIYGLEGQTAQSFLLSLDKAIGFEPQELYLYPLYVRPLTGLDRWGGEWDDVRLDCYRAGRELLLSHGYQQLSMRMFRKTSAPDGAGPIYCCQEDGIVGIGCGARSYTRSLHYSGEFAVGATGVKEIIADYISKPSSAFGVADYGAILNEEDQRRRWVIKSLLRSDGLNLNDYVSRFGTRPDDDLPELSELIELQLAQSDGATIRLNAAGLELSDAVGPWLYSRETRQRMESFALR